MLLLDNESGSSELVSATEQHGLRGEGSKVSVARPLRDLSQICLFYILKQRPSVAFGEICSCRVLSGHPRLSGSF